jgi:nucleoside-diphosphate-sugar epimerase
VWRIAINDGLREAGGLEGRSAEGGFVMTKTVLIAGGSGVVGFSALEEFLADDDWDVINVSRRRPEPKRTRPFRHLSVDLRNADQCKETLGNLRGVTHVVYASLYEKPGLIAGWTERDQMETNLQMLMNTLEPLSTGTNDLKHVSILQGTKAYGLHLHPITIPARERAPRDRHENFYWLQEDYIVQRAGALGFDFTILRPQLIVGAPFGAAMNLAPVIGAYAAICAELGEPFGFPGGPSYVWEAVDARLLAKVLKWATGAPQAKGQHFNVTNGDVFEWRSLWPMFAEVLGVRLGSDNPRSLGSFLPANADVWRGIVKKHDLRKIEIEELVGESHHYADFCFAFGAKEAYPPAFVSTVKLRQAGFCEFVDTEDMFRHWLSYLIDEKVIPKSN